MPVAYKCEDYVAVEKVSWHAVNTNDPRERRAVYAD